MSASAGGPPEPGRIHSIRQRLLNHARANGEEFQFVLDRFAVERLLYRLSISPYRDEFMLKGAMLFALWFDAAHRPTRDADFLGFGAPDAGRLATTIRELCAIESDDGLVFDLDALTVAEIREEARYNGLRVSLRARLGQAACMIQWDVGFGDAVSPGPQEVTLPTLLDDMPSPRLQVYPRESVFAEKLEALVLLGIANRRMKDYFDLLGLAREGRMDAEALARAIEATFDRRGTPIPRDMPMGLSGAFGGDLHKQQQWKAFLSRNRLVAPSLEESVAELAAFAHPILGRTRGPGQGG